MSTFETLLSIARQHGTPTYAFDVRRLREQADRLRDGLPEDVEVYYSLKANASLGVCEVFANHGLGADVASAGELATALAAGFPAEKIFVAGPFKLPETIEQLRSCPQAIISIDSVSELSALVGEELPNRVVLRLRPDFSSKAVVAAGCESRFGLLLSELASCRESLDHVNLIGFHIFAGSQLLDSACIVEQIRAAGSLAARAAETLGVRPQLLNLPGGFGIPYGPGQEELDLAPIRDELQRQAEQTSARLVLELGRYLVAQAGWYLTSVLGFQTYQQRPAVVVDGGTHQRADMCGLCLRTCADPPVVLAGEPSGPAKPTDVLGCLSLPADVMSESSLLPPLSAGDVLAYANAGAYGLWSSPAIFHGSPLPAEVAFDGSHIEVMRERKPAASILDDQRPILRKTVDVS